MDGNTLEAPVRSAEIVIHCAAFVEQWGPPDAWDRINVQGPWRMLGAAQQARRRTDSPRGSKVVCTKRALDAALLAAVRAAHEIGFLAGQQERYADHTRPGSPARPAWMDIPLDHRKEHGIRLKPVVLQSLSAAGYRCLGDLRWVPERQLVGLHYVGIKTARALRAVVERFEAAEPPSESARRPAHPMDGPASL